MSVLTVTTNQHHIIERFKAFYENLNNLKLDEIDTIYTNDITFQDPVVEIRGVDDLYRHMNGLCTSLQHGRFEYLDELIGQDRAYIKWNMHFSHTKLGSKTITLRGISHIHFTGRIHFHEDVYDMGQMIYEHVPILGGMTRWLKTRLKKIEDK
jgi:hypothetical protein